LTNAPNAAACWKPCSPSRLLNLSPPPRSPKRLLRLKRRSKVLRHPANAKHVRRVNANPARINPRKVRLRRAHLLQAHRMAIRNPHKNDCTSKSPCHVETTRQ